jgi:hypothetical protein
LADGSQQLSAGSESARWTLDARAEAAFDSSDPEFVGALKDHLASDPCLVVDTVGGLLLAALISAVGPKSRPVVISTTKPSSEVSILDFYRNGLVMGLLHHFRDKAELPAEVLRQRDTGGEQRADELAAAGCSGAEITVRIKRDELRDPDLVRVWATLAPAASRPGHPAHEYFVQRYERYRELIAHELRERGGASGLADGI